MVEERNYNAMNENQGTEMNAGFTSAETTEIINRQPQFLLRWGIAIIFIFFLLVFLASWFIKYPEKVNTQSTLSALNVPKGVLAYTDGKLTKLFVKEGDSIPQNHILGYIESDADHSEVLQLAEYLDSLSVLNDLELEKKIAPYSKSYNKLGELQYDFQLYQQSLVVFADYVANGYYLRKLDQLKKDQKYLQELSEVYREEKNITTRDVQLYDSNFKINGILAHEKVISKTDYWNEESKLLQKRMQLQQANASSVLNESKRHDKLKEITELENIISIQKGIFIQSLNTFRSKILAWKKKYLLIAPTEGIVRFPQMVQENMQLKKDQLICYINAQRSELFMESFISQTNLGKVKVGQEVILKFDAYPYVEYGTVIGKVSFISNTPASNGYYVQISLPHELTTTYNKTLVYKTGLLASSEIIVEESNLLNSMFNKVRKKIQ